MKTLLAILACFVFLLLNCGLVLGAAPQFSPRSIMDRYNGSFSVSENVEAGAALMPSYKPTRSWSKIST